MKNIKMYKVVLLFLLNISSAIIMAQNVEVNLFPKKGELSFNVGNIILSGQGEILLYSEIPSDFILLNFAHH